MKIFGSKKRETNEDFAHRLMVNANEAMTKVMDDRSYMEYIKLSLEFNIMVLKNRIDEERFLIERMEYVFDIRQKEVKNVPNLDHKIIIEVFEIRPDFIKKMKTKLKEEEDQYVILKKRCQDSTSSLDETIRKFYGKDEGEAKE